MRKPNCLNIVETNKLWEIAIEFLNRLDESLMEYNLKLAYIMFKFAKLERLSFNKIKKFVFVSCFNDIGRLHLNQNNSSKSIETYLFLKYFSPLGDFSNVLLEKTLYEKNNKYRRDALRFKICKDYTKNLVLYNDKDKALNYLMEENYLNQDFKKLSRLVKSSDLLHELHSYNYKDQVYQLMSYTMFKNSEKVQLIEMLSSLFEMYSVQTLYHSQVTAYTAYYLGKKMKINKTDNKKLYIGALCHDLGKVCIPLSILEKAGKLTNEEYEVMKTHVTHTKEILEHELNFDIIEIAYRHHERIDGTGYPNMIPGERMTLEQKIIQVADVYSALIAKRSYKDELSLTETLNIIGEEAKRNKLDQSVVDVLNSNGKKIVKKTNKLMEQANYTYGKISNERKKLIELYDIKPELKTIDL